MTIPNENAFIIGLIVSAMLGSMLLMIPLMATATLRGQVVALPPHQLSKRVPLSKPSPEINIHANIVCRTISWIFRERRGLAIISTSAGRNRAAQGAIGKVGKSEAKGHDRRLEQRQRAI